MVMFEQMVVNLLITIGLVIMSFTVLFLTVWNCLNPILERIKETGEKAQ